MFIFVQYSVSNVSNFYIVRLYSGVTQYSFVRFCVLIIPYSQHSRGGIM